MEKDVAVAEVLVLIIRSKYVVVCAIRGYERYWTIN